MSNETMVKQVRLFSERVAVIIEESAIVQLLEAELKEAKEKAKPYEQSTSE